MSYLWRFIWIYLPE